MTDRHRNTRRSKGGDASSCALALESCSSIPSSPCALSSIVKVCMPYDVAVATVTPLPIVTSFDIQDDKFSRIDA